MFPRAEVFMSLALLALLPVPFQGTGQSAAPWWVWLMVIVGVLAMLLIWWLFRRQLRPAPGPEVRVKAAAPADDLTRIEGIGPKIAELLRKAGITTYAQLAETDVERLRQILDEARLLQIADPGTWPEQARLAAEGRWEELKALQDELKGGRRV